MTMTLEGYSAPITAGNFAMNVMQKLYVGKALTVDFTGVLVGKGGITGSLLLLLLLAVLLLLALMIVLLLALLQLLLPLIPSPFAACQGLYLHIMWLLMRVKHVLPCSSIVYNSFAYRPLSFSGRACWQLVFRTC